MCKKQTSVSHSSTESEVIFLVAHGWYSRSRSVGFWSLKYCTLPKTHQYRETCCATGLDAKHTNTKTKNHTNRDDIEFFGVDHVTTNAKPSHSGALVCIFDDSEAVIKMIFSAEVRRWHMCPEPTELRLIGCLTESNLRPKIQSKSVVSPNQVADMLMKGDITRDERNHLLRLFNITSFSMFSCSPFSQVTNHVEEAGRRKKNQDKRNVRLQNQNQR